MVQKGRNSFYAIHSLGKRGRGTNPAIANKLYWGTMIPSMLYGVQVLCPGQTGKEHRSFDKRIQCLPDTTSKLGAYRLLGWNPVRAYCDLAILTFFYKTLLRQYQLNNLVDKKFGAKNFHTVGPNKKKTFKLFLDNYVRGNF